MKKILLTIAVCLCVSGLASAQDWSVGGRVGSGLQAVGQYHGFGDVAGKPFYLEGRFGMSWCNPGASLMADFTALAAWNCFEFGNYNAGNFFADFGAGISVGGREHYAYVGVAGLAKIGFKFSGAPVSLSFDWTPAFGPEIAYYGKQTIQGVTIPGPSASDFFEYGLANFGITCTYNF